MSTHITEKESAPAVQPEARETAERIFQEHLPLFKSGQIIIIDDTTAARRIAHAAGVAEDMESIPMTPDGVAMAIGEHGGGVVLIQRFFGWRDAKENGWTALIGPAHLLARIAKDNSGETCDPGTIMTLVRIPGAPGPRHMRWYVVPNPIQDAPAEAEGDY